MTTNIKQLTQDALNCYTSGAAVIISGTDGFPLHGLKTFLEAPGSHLCVSFAGVDRAAFENARVSDELEQAREQYLKRWKLRP
jgi:hypothetical protein